LKEVEVKILGIDRETVEATLKSLGATKTFEGDEETVFFDFPDNSVTRGENLIRLRKIGDKAVLTFKKFVKNDAAKVRDEYEVSVSDFDSMRLILESLGLSEFRRMEKHRISYALKSGVKADLDKYVGAFSYIPDLMELEGEDVATVRSHIRLLGFQPEDGKPWTTFELIDHYSGKKGKP
jgi:predicted adenylyl cyclase CyaB